MPTSSTRHSQNLKLMSLSNSPLNRRSNSRQAKILPLLGKKEQTLGAWKGNRSRRKHRLRSSRSRLQKLMPLQGSTTRKKNGKGHSGELKLTLRILSLKVFLLTDVHLKSQLRLEQHGMLPIKLHSIYSRSRTIYQKVIFQLATSISRLQR